MNTTKKRPKRREVPPLVDQPNGETGVAVLFLLLVMLALAVGFALYLGTGFILAGPA